MLLLFLPRRKTETVKKEGPRSPSNGIPSLDWPLKLEELAEMNVEDLIKENLEISGKKLEIMSERQLGVALDDLVLKKQRQAINENVGENLKKNNKRPIKRNVCEDKDEQEVRPTFMITVAAAV